ncbi:MAG TPA: MBL fold metallo-hydrolase, partial [Ramlibacter sp.]|nr:MBL fold metallo-hydrolase [Ramlibacter sp.]
MAIALLLAAGFAAAQEAPRKVVAQQVSSSAWFVQGEASLGTPANRNFISNAGFVVTPGGVVVIDALGSPQLARELLAEIARVTPLPVTHVVVTHYHADHIYGLQVFRAAGARIVAHPAALEYLNSETARQR